MTESHISWMTVLHCYIMWFHKSRDTKNTIHIRACSFTWGKARGVSDDVSRWLNILCIMFKILSFFIIMLFSWLYVRVGNLLRFWRNLHNHIISLRGEFWAHTIGFNPALSFSRTLPCQFQRYLAWIFLGLSSFQTVSDMPAVIKK